MRQHDERNMSLSPPLSGWAALATSLGWVQQPLLGLCLAVSSSLA